MDQSNSATTDTRASAMRVMALAPWSLFEQLTQDISAASHEVLRAPESGLVMVRGRMGATGNAFNLGEMTLTRCAVKLASGTVGHAYVQGRNRAHAHRAALCDALLQDQPAAIEPTITALRAHLFDMEHAEAAKVAATKVDFFTMVRGDV